MKIPGTITVVLFIVLLWALESVDSWPYIDTERDLPEDIEALRDTIEI